MALLADSSLSESCFTVVTGGDGGVGDEPAWLGGIGAGWAGSLTLVPLSRELSLLADSGATFRDFIFALGGNETDQKCGNDEKLK